jgi:hypothetical protein
VDPLLETSFLIFLQDRKLQSIFYMSSNWLLLHQRYRCALKSAVVVLGRESFVDSIMSIYVRLKTYPPAAKER